MARPYFKILRSYRGYYMAARRYEISLWVLKILRTSDIFFQHEKRNFVSPSGHVMFYLLYKHQWTTKPFHFNSFWCERRDLLCSHSNGDIFTCEDNMLFSHVKISSFRAKAHLVFHWCLYNNNFSVITDSICSPNTFFLFYSVSDAVDELKNSSRHGKYLENISYSQVLLA